MALTWTAPADNGGSSITDYTIQYSGTELMDDCQSCGVHLREHYRDWFDGRNNV
jgi:hypothetical protein